MAETRAPDCWPAWRVDCTDARCAYGPFVALIHAPHEAAALLKARHAYREFDPETIAVRRAEGL